MARMPCRRVCLPRCQHCGCSLNESISYTQSNPATYGIDLVEDPDFPCDLFQFYFGVPQGQLRGGQGLFEESSDDCGSLGSSGFVRHLLGRRAPNADQFNTQVGSPKDAPVMLISAACLTRMNGGARLYGTLFVTDVEDPDAELASNGTNTVYGSVIVDGASASTTGTFQVVWNDNTRARPAAAAASAPVIGGWSDFHATGHSS